MFLESSVSLQVSWRSFEVLDSHSRVSKRDLPMMTSFHETWMNHSLFFFSLWHYTPANSRLDSHAFHISEFLAWVLTLSNGQPRIHFILILWQRWTTHSPYSPQWLRFSTPLYLSSHSFSLPNSPQLPHHTSKTIQKHALIYAMRHL